MKRLLQSAGALFTYFSMATVIALSAAVATLWLKGALTPGRLYRVLGALHGIDIVTLQQQQMAERDETAIESRAYATRRKLLMLNSLDQDLRELAIGNSWVEMNDMKTNLDNRSDRFEEIKNDYAAKLADATDEQEAGRLKEVQRTLEAINPDQAKEQMLKMVDDDAMDDVVTIIKNMPVDKRKKIIGEFKRPAETETLHEILTKIRNGEPFASNLKETQDKLQDF